MREIDTSNAKVRDNWNREKAEEDARGYREQYAKLTDDLEQTRQAKRDLLSGAKLPLDGLSVEDGALTSQGERWDNMSGSDEWRVATAIDRCLNQQCGFVLLE